MKIPFYSLLAVLLGYSAAFGQQKFISVSGRQILGPDGKNFLIRGTNLGNWLVPEGYMFKFEKTNSPRLINETFLELIGPDKTRDFWRKYLDSYITRADIHYLKSIGVNTIRIPFNYRLFTEEDYLGGRGKSRGFRLMDSVISWCRRDGIYAILDMHCAPGGQTGDNIDDGWGYPFLFENEGSQQLVCEIWKQIAAHYAHETAVMGYDLLNEPIAHYFDKSKFNPLLEPLFKRIAKAIRQVDANHILFLGGAQWDSNFSPFGPPFDKKLVYTFHKYWTEPDQQVIQDYIDFSDKYQVPIYCGETGENTDEWVKRFRLVLEKNNIGWDYWPYKKIDNTRGIMTFDRPPYYDSVIRFADTVRSTFAEIRNLRPKNEALVMQALDGFLNNCLFANCRPNDGYIEALGFGKSK